MRRYELVSGAFFALLAAVQFCRLLFRWPVQIAGVTVPLWPSLFALAITASLALWAFRALANRQTSH